MKRIVIAALVEIALCGCSVSNCYRSKAALDGAQILYDAALASGQVDKLAEYRWAVDAARAVHEIVCAEGVE